MATKGIQAMATAIQAPVPRSHATALEVAVGFLRGIEEPGPGWANAQEVNWRLPVQSLAQIDVLAEAAGMSRSRAALTIINAGWMQIIAALPTRAERERFQAAMASAAEERLKAGDTEVIHF
jgi:hypothetical protein